MVVICKDSYRCETEWCKHYVPHKHESYYTETDRFCIGDCHMIKGGQLVMTWCVRHTAAPSWEA